MLFRVVPQSLRYCSITAPARAIALVPFLTSRTYAKHNRPKRLNDHKPSQGNSVINQYGVESDNTRELPQNLSNLPTPEIRNRSGDPNFSKVREESRTFWKNEAEPASVGTEQDSSPTGSTASPEQYAEPAAHLPDLTRGIPSTLDAELADASQGSRAGSSSLDITESSSAGSRGGEGLPNSTYISSLERRRNRIANYLYAAFLSLSVVGTIYLGRNWDTEDEEKKHPDAPSGWGLRLFYNRGNARVRDMLDYYNEPAFSKLLPNTDPMWERPYTLVLSLEDLLVHSEWTREHGWRMAKRPGVDYFLRYLSQYYELVIFTSVPSMIGDPIIRKLDPFRIVMWPLFREATRFKDGDYIKACVLK